MYRRRLNHTPTRIGEFLQPTGSLSYEAGALALDILIEAGLSNSDVFYIDCTAGFAECERFLANIRALSTKRASETR